MFQESKELPVTAPAKVGQYHELAEAIRRGCKTTKPLNAEYVSLDGNYACALGAAAIATGFRWRIDEPDEPDFGTAAEHLNTHFPVIWNRFPKSSISLHSLITMRNDRGWTREAIADWLDTL